MSKFSAVVLSAFVLFCGANVAVLAIAPSYALSDLSEGPRVMAAAMARSEAWSLEDMNIDILYAASVADCTAWPDGTLDCSRDY